MAKWTSRTIDIQKIEAAGQSGILLIKLMICCNDLSLANQSLAKWKDEESLNIDEKSRQQGAGMYFVRIQLSHLFEGLSIIQQIVDEPSLVEFINSLDEETKASFKTLCEYLDGAPKRAQLKRYIELMRHKLTFHYDESPKLINKAIKNLASKDETRYSRITRGDHAFRWYFKVGDDVVNNLVVRHLWGDPEGVNSNAEIDEIVIWSHSLFVTFMDFSGEFIWQFTEK